MDKDTSAQDSLEVGINNPELDKSLKPTVRALKDERQAWSVFSNLRDSNKTRNDIFAKIAEKINGNQPFPDQRKTAQGWKSNFSLLFLSGVLGQIVPSLTSFIENAKFLTQSKLKDESPEGQKKSEILREKFTSLMRRWPDFRSFYSSLCQELVSTGYGFVIRTDEYDWRGKFYRQDEAFVPDGTPQYSKGVQVLGVKQDFLIDEITSIIRDKEAAEAAKWDVDNTVEAINKAIPYDQLTQSDTTQNPRKWEDAIREGNLGISHSAGAKIVEAAHLFAVETGEDGKVTHVILDRNAEHAKLLWHESRFDSMRDVVNLFTLEPGNGKFYSPKGIARQLVNYAIAIDNLVNRAMDNLFLAGLIVITWDPARGLPNPKIKVPFLSVHPDAKMDQKPKLQATVNEFVAAVNFVVEQAQRAVGAYLSTALTPEGQGTQADKTARQATIEYQRELQSKAAFIARFAGQWSDYVGTAQRIACNPDTNDPEAKEFRELVLGDKENGIEPVVTEEELKEWAESPAAEVLQDLTQSENQAKLAVTQGIFANPLVQRFYDMKKVSDAGITAAMGGNPQFVKDITLPDAMDPTSEIEGFRQQQLETEAILAGASMPVSPRDLHKTHLDQLIPDMQKGAQNLQQNPQQALDHPEILDHNHAGIVHGVAHVEEWKKQGALPQETAPYEQALSAGEQGLTQFAKQLQQMKAQQEQQKAEQEAQMQAQMQPPVDQNQAIAEEGKPLPMTEKLAVAWIGQYDKLGQPERTRLEALTGLLQPHEEIAKHIDNANSPPIPLDNSENQAQTEPAMQSTPEPPPI